MAVALEMQPRDAPPACLTLRAAVVEQALRRSAPPRSTRVGAMAAYHMGWRDADGRPAAGSSGKLLRAGLCLWAAEAVGGEAAQALPAALAVEWLHNFTLVHDDIQDGDRERRHRATAWAVFGEAQAINCGDGLHELAHELLLRPGPRPARRLRAARALSRATLAVIEGQCLDLDLEGRPPTSTATYLRMARLKTGALFGGALECGALLGGARPAVAARLRQAGRDLGAAFQVRDDWLGTWGDPTVTGKPRGADLARRKHTFAMAIAAESAAPEQRRRLRRAFADRGDHGTALLRSLLDELEAGERTAATAQALGEQACARLAACDLASDRLEELSELARYATERVR